jgi:hypothetical protein
VNTSTLAWIELGSEPYRATLDLLQIVAVNELTPLELIETAGKIGLQDCGMEVTDGEEFIDFLEFVENWNREVAGNAADREDWLKAFPALRDWSPIVHLKESLPAEIKLAFHLLKEGRRGTIPIFNE